ncbi:MAG: insulinase family protein [Bacteroidales bacterium]|jgi:predicted Zn-dependent peptidase|nr:insulinase family protein [Bacteroidales bacterium]
MKKRQLIFIFFLFYGGIAFSQTSDVLKVTQFTLDNGLTVYLNEDHSLPQTYGCVVVNAGGKNDPKEATGIAHYLEHVMFKGTDKIGTLNWEAEKPLLDSISIMYDQLAQTQGMAQRKEVQATINRLSLQAAEYAIPNEVDLILQSIGSKAVNAMTAEEMTIYFNMFPSNQIEKWIDIYVERFRNPIFRLFQSELETVYEEKNMYEDLFYVRLMESYLKNFYKKHPYGQQTIIGTTEHLKNPRLSKMVDFYNTYYVANNMALILMGDFDTEKIIPLLKEKFAVWQNKPVPSYPVYKEAPFKGREEVNMKLTPVKMGIIGYRTVPAKHEDEIALEICSQILSNEGSTGLIDQLLNENKILVSYIFNMVNNDLGGLHVLFVPKIFSQKLSDAEKLVHEQFHKLRSGEFSDQLFESVKLNFLREHYQQLEEPWMRGYKLTYCFIQNKSWEEELAVAEKVKQLTKEEIIRVAQQYFGDNYLVFNSHMGFPKKDKIDKPDWKPVVSKNSDKKSEFAQWIASVPETELPPQFVDFNKDLIIDTLCNGVDYYQTTNPMNQVFSLDFRFKVGTANEHRYENVVEYLNEVGTVSLKTKDFKAALQTLGAELSFHCDKNYFTVSIKGFDEKLDETLQLVSEFFKNPQVAPKIIQKMYENEKANYKLKIGDPSTLGDALIEYVQYGQKSSFIDKLTINEVKKLQPATLIDLFKDVITYESEVHYSGTLPVTEVKTMLLKNIIFSKEPQKALYIETPVAEIIKPKVYLNNNTKSLQSNIYFLSNGAVANEKDKAHLKAFNEYFGMGMSALVFQEIREFRSLGYSTYAYYSNPILKANKGYLVGYLGTQSDKTIEGVSALVDLVKNMPQKPERIETLKRSLLQSINMENVSFRELSWQVSQWRLQGYTEDPRKFRYKIFENLTFDDIVSTYHKFIHGNPIAVTISGNLKKIDTKAFAPFGEVVKVKVAEMIRQ